MFRTPLAVVNRIQSRGNSPNDAKGTTPFASRPKIQRSPVAGEDQPTAVSALAAENVPQSQAPTPLAPQSTIKSTIQPRMTEGTHVSSIPAVAAGTVAAAAPHSVIKILPPTPMAQAPALLRTAIKPGNVGLTIADTPLTTPSRRLAPQEFQEYIKHFRSPVDKFRKQHDRLIAMQGTPTAYPQTIPIAALAVPEQPVAPAPVEETVSGTVRSRDKLEAAPAANVEDLNPFLPARSLARSPEAAPDVVSPCNGPETETDFPVAAMDEGSTMTVADSAAGAEKSLTMAVEETEQIPAVVPSPCEKEAPVQAVTVANFIPAGRMLSRTPPAKATEEVTLPTPVSTTEIVDVVATIATTVDVVEAPEPEFKRVDLSIPSPVVATRAFPSPAAQRTVEASSSPLATAEAETRDEACNTSIFVSTTPAKTVVQDTELLSKYSALQEATEQLEELLENRNRYCESLEDDYEEAQGCIMDFECRIAEDAMKLSVLEAELREQKLLNTFDKIRCLDAETHAEEAQLVIVRLLGEKEELQAIALEEKPTAALVIAPEENIGPKLSQHRMSISSPIYPAEEENKITSPENSFAMDDGAAVDDVDFGFDDNDEIHVSSAVPEIDSPLTSARVRCDSYTTTSPVAIKKSPMRSQRKISRTDESSGSESNQLNDEESYHFDERCPQGYRIKGMRFIPLEAPKLHYAPIEVDLSANKEDAPQRGRKGKSAQSRVPKSAPPAEKEEPSVDVAKEEESAVVDPAVVEEKPVVDIEVDAESPAPQCNVKGELNKTAKPSMRVVPIESRKKRKRDDSEKPASAKREVISLIDDPKTIAPAKKLSHAELMKIPGYSKFCAITGPELSVLKAGISQDAMNDLLVEMWDVSTEEEKKQWEDYVIMQPSSKKQKSASIESPLKTVEVEIVAEVSEDPVEATVEISPEKKEVKATSKKGNGKKNKKKLTTAKKVEPVSAPEPPTGSDRKRKNVDDIFVAEETLSKKADLAAEQETLPAKADVTTPAAKPPKRRRSTRKSATQDKVTVEEKPAAPIIPDQSHPAKLSIENVQKASLDSTAHFDGMSPIAATPSDAKVHRLMRSASKAVGRRLSTVSMASSVTESFHHNQMKSNTSTTSSAAGRRIVIPKLKAKMKK